MYGGHWRRLSTTVVIFLATVAGSAACATHEQWDTWKNHSSHFASGDHLSFSVRNPGTTARKVTRQDVALARDEAWWGQPVTVSQAEIIER